MSVKRIALFVSAFACLAALACGCSHRLELAQRTVLDTTMNDGSLTTMHKAIEKTDLADTLRGSQFYTVLAATNEAFRTLPPNKMHALFKKKNRDLLEALVKFHVIEGEYTAEYLEKIGTITTLNGAEITFERVGDKLFVNGAEVRITDIHCRNGIIHIIDGVLIPPCPRIPAEPAEPATDPADEDVAEPVVPDAPAETDPSEDYPREPLKVVIYGITAGVSNGVEGAQAVPVRVKEIYIYIAGPVDETRRREMVDKIMGNDEISRKLAVFISEHTLEYLKNTEGVEQMLAAKLKPEIIKIIGAADGEVEDVQISKLEF